jgi:hypothetical protein
MKFSLFYIFFFVVVVAFNEPVSNEEITTSPLLSSKTLGK